jgi:hypothetical protein
VSCFHGEEEAGIPNLLRQERTITFNTPGFGENGPRDAGGCGKGINESRKMPQAPGFGLSLYCRPFVRNYSVNIYLETGLPEHIQLGRYRVDLLLIRHLLQANIPSGFKKQRDQIRTVLMRPSILLILKIVII